MKNVKRLIMIVGIANFLLFILIIVIPNTIQYKYLKIIDGTKALILLLFSFLPFYITILALKIKKMQKQKIVELDGKKIVGIMFFCLLSFVNLIIIRYLYVDVFESQTTCVDNYLLLDNGFNDADISIFPKIIPKNAQNVKYSYRYRTIDGNYWDSDFDLYLEMSLSDDEYLKEKERIKLITNYEKIENGYYLNSSEEYIKLYKKNGTLYELKKVNNYYFVSFFDDENKIIYNFSFGYIKPYFISINEKNIHCEVGICKIHNKI